MGTLVLLAVRPHFMDTRMACCRNVSLWRIHDAQAGVVPKTHLCL